MPLLALLAIKLKWRFSTKRRSWQTAILLKESLIEELTGWLTVSTGRMIEAKNEKNHYKDEIDRLLFYWKNLWSRNLPLPHREQREDNRSQKRKKFNTKKKLTNYYFIERIFDRGTYRLAHREQRKDDSSGGEAKKEKNSTQRRNWQTTILLQESLIEKLAGSLTLSDGRMIVRVDKPRTKKIQHREEIDRLLFYWNNLWSRNFAGWLTMSNGRMIVRVEKPKEKKIYAVGILSKYEANMCWVKIRERRLCPLTAYLGVELYPTEVLMMQKWNLAAVVYCQNTKRTCVG